VRVRNGEGDATSTETAGEATQGTPAATAAALPMVELIDQLEYPSENEEVDETVDAAADELFPVTYEDAAAHPEVYAAGAGPGEAPTNAADRKKAYQESWVHMDPKDVNIPRPPEVAEPAATRGPAGVMKPDAKALDYFELFWPRAFRVDALLKPTWTYAAARGAGSTDFYTRYTPMGLHSLDHCLAILIRNGLNPVPNIATDLLCKPHPFVFGDGRVTSLFDDPVYEWKAFRAFFHPGAVDCSSGHPINKKLGLVLDHTRLTCERLWRFGPTGSIDEMTMGFQGRCSFKQRITYKVEGDGFQVDALCDAGYTYSWAFRVMAPPKVLPLDLKGVSPLHTRMFFLLSRLGAHSGSNCECCKSRFVKQPCCAYEDIHENTKVWMDNLYLSVRIAELARQPGMPWPVVLVAGPTRTNRGIPEYCIQKRESNEKKRALAKGTIKVAVRNGVLCCSIYDNAPVHMISTIDSSVELIKVKEFVRAGAEPEAVFRLRMIDLYNKFMNSEHEPR
jgi:hypothetical protein